MTTEDITFQQNRGEKSEKQSESKRARTCASKKKSHTNKGFFGALSTSSNQQKSEALQTDQTLRAIAR